ncbi:hypothetical protein [Streptomyces californicus]|uniref:hypothetical protein n=1 Tax=Streptomyces californicus TaxID=67351 RepID=UPI0037B39435
MTTHLTDMEIDEITRAFAIADDDLDELVHDACSNAASKKVNGDRGGLDFETAYDQFHDDAELCASSINNSGISAQLRFLTSVCDTTQALRSLLRERHL